MTTMELIEKYGVGANCLSDAYDVGVEQGRTEAEAEHEKICETCIHKVSAEDIKAIRADALKPISDLVFHYLIDDEARAVTILDAIRNYISEQIKEQTDEMC